MGAAQLCDLGYQSIKTSITNTGETATRILGQGARSKVLLLFLRCLAAL